MELRGIRRQIDRQNVGYFVNVSCRYIIRPSDTSHNIKLRQTHTQSQYIVHIQIGLHLRDHHVDETLDLAEGHGLHFIKYQCQHGPHSLRPLEVIPDALTDPPVGYGLNAFQCLRSGGFHQLIVFSSDIFRSLDRVFIQLLDLIILYIHGNTADGIHQIRHRLEVDHHIIADVQIHGLIQRFHAHLRPVIGTGMGDFIEGGGISHLQIRIPVYGNNLHIIGVLVDADDHDGIASGSLDILHITAVHAKKQNIDVSVHIGQRQVVILRRCFMHLFYRIIHITVDHDTQDKEGKNHDNGNQQGDLLPGSQTLKPVYRAFTLLLFLSAHCSNIPFPFPFLPAASFSSISL